MLKEALRPMPKAPTPRSQEAESIAEESPEVSSLGTYYKEISGLEVLSEEKERSLAGQIEAGLFVKRLMFPEGKERVGISLIGPQIEAYLTGPIYDAVNTTLAELKRSSLDEAIEQSDYDNVIDGVGKKREKKEGKLAKYGINHRAVWNIAIAQNLCKSRGERPWEEYIEKIVEEGEEARNKFAEGNLKLVPSAVKMLAEAFGKENLKALISIGNEELLTSVLKGFDFRRGRFSTYAYRVLRNNCKIKFSGESNSITNLDSSEQAELRKMSEVRNKFCEKHGRWPTLLDIKNELGPRVSLENVLAKLQFLSPQQSLDDPIQAEDDENSDTVGGLIPDNGNTDPVRITESKEIRTKREALYSRLMEVAFGHESPLDDRGQIILALRFFGLNENGEKLALEKIAEIFNVTRERVRQIIEKALNKLKNKLSSLNDFHYDPME